LFGYSPGVAFSVQAAPPLADQPTIFIVDDDAPLRTAVARLIQSVGLQARTFDSAEAFLGRVDTATTGCAILDVRMRGASGLELQQSMRTAGYQLPVIFVSAHADVALTVRAMRAGALQVFTKPFDDQELLDAIHEALVIDARGRAAHRELEDLRDRADALTAREREVMRLVVTGMLNKQIASELGTTEKTVKAHRAQVVRKMRVQSVAELVRVADRLSAAGPLSAIGPRAKAAGALV
jgi:FixJ family two-component response regulator